MRKRMRIKNLSLCVGGLTLAGLAGPVLGQLAVTGNLTTTPANYGQGASSPYTGQLATQTINTAFGDSTVGDGTSTGGSELDAAYGVVQSGNLNVFLAGNFEGNGNHVDLFIDDGAVSAPNTPSGQNTLNISNGWTAAAMNGSVFSPGFNADLLLDANDFSEQLYVDQYKLNTTGSSNSYLGSVSLTGGIGAGSLGGINFGLNNTNAAGVNGNGGTAADPTAAQAVATGLEFSIPMSLLGNPTNIKVLAFINGNNDDTASNQALPGLPVGTGNLTGGPYAGPTGGAFNFSTLTNEYFAVPVGGIANGTWLNPVSGFSWGAGANWSNSYVPHLAGDAANFAGATSTSTVTLDAPRTVGSMSFTSSANPYTIAAGTGGVLTLDNGANPATINNYDGSNTISAPVVLNSNTTITVINSSDTFSISGNVSGSGSLTVDAPGSGSVVLSGTNTYGGGTSVLEGTLKMGSATALPTGTALTLSAQDLPAGVLNLNGFNATVSSITVLTGPKTAGTKATAQINNTSTTGTATFTYAGTNANPSVLNNCNITDSSASAGGITALHVASGSLTLGGNDTYGGTTTVDPGAALTFGITSTAGPSGTTYPSGGNTVNNGSLILNDTIQAGNISGSGTTTVVAGNNVFVTNLNQAGLVNNGSVEVTTGTVGPITGSGILQIDSTLQLALNSGASSQNVLAIAGTLDITNNHMFINYGAAGTGDPISTIVSLIDQAALNGQPAGSPVTWTGTGITSSLLNTTIPGNSAGSYGIGYADSADPGNPAQLASGQIEIMYTLLGDANLDGKVNGTDFNILAANFNTGGDSWDQGDFTYDGKVNGSDFNLLAANFNQGATQSADLAAVEAFASANGLSASVPEPGLIGLATFGTVGVLLRRRRSAKGLQA